MAQEDFKGYFSPYLIEANEGTPSSARPSPFICPRCFIQKHHLLFDLGFRTRQRPSLIAVRLRLHRSRNDTLFVCVSHTCSFHWVDTFGYIKLSNTIRKPSKQAWHAPAPSAAPEIMALKTSLQHFFIWGGRKLDTPDCITLRHARRRPS